MSCDQFKVLYQNRNCYQKNIDGFMYKSGYELHGTIHENRKGLKGFKLFAIENTKFSEPKKDSSNFSFNSSNFVVSDTECEDYLKSKNLIPKYYFRLRSLPLFPDERSCFCVSTFMKELYVFGGLSYKYTKYGRYKETCFKLNKWNSLNKWTYIAPMKINRSNAACAGFEGKLVATGGNTSTSLVEAYDHHEDNWTFLGKMQNLRYSHSAVSMGNKLFVIGGRNHDSNLEIFDSVDRKFTLVNCNAKFATFDDLKAVQGACCLGSNILVVSSFDNKYKFTVYDDEIKDFRSLAETKSAE